MAFRWFLVAASALGLVLSAGCSGATPIASQGALPVAAPRPATGSAGQYIKHVVIIIQENRSFENFFAGYPGANAPMFGHAFSHGGRRVKVPLHSTTFETNPNLAHLWTDAIGGWDKGKMDGFHTGPNKNYAAYAYIEESQVAPYWDMAQQYVLADEMFPTEFGPSFTGHLNLVAGTDSLSATTAQVNFPTHTPNDCDAPPGTKSSLVNTYRQVGRGNGPFPCFTQFDTMATTLDTAGVSWKYYVTKLLNAGIWSAFEAISYVRNGPDWNTDIITPQTKILTDPGNGQLASVSWVTPDHLDSDHPGAHSDLGPSWVASVVNAIGESSYWDSTAIIVIWDDWGGWYDNAAPPQLDYRGLGIRVPCLIISPYARETSASQPGYVSHTQYEYGSVLKFIEQVFNVPPLGPYGYGYTDQRANSILDSFDFTQQPRPFSAIPSKYPISHFVHEPPSNQPVDTE